MHYVFHFQSMLCISCYATFIAILLKKTFVQIVLT